MDFIALVIFLLVIVGRALSETKRKQGQHEENQQGSERRGRKIPWDLPGPKEDAGPFGGPWGFPVPGFPDKENNPETQKRGYNMAEEALEPLAWEKVEQEVTFPEGEGFKGEEADKYQSFLEGMGPEGSRSTEGPKREKKVREKVKKKIAVAPQRTQQVLGLNEMVRGVIMAEILGPPRAKKSFRLK